MPTALAEPPPAMTAPPSIPSPPPPQLPKPVRPSDPKPPEVQPAAKKPSERASDALKDFTDKPDTQPGDKKSPPTNKDAVADKKQSAAPSVDKDAEPAEGDKTPAAEPKKDGKIFKVYDELKAKYAALEKEHGELMAKTVDPEKEKQYTERLTKAEKREKELVDELRFHNFEKYDADFQKDYVKPYNEQWQRGVREISQLPVTEIDGTTRAGTASDLSELMALSNNPSRRLQVAKDKFGDEFYRDAIEEAKKSQELFEKMDVAREDARKTLGEKEAKRNEEFKTYHNMVKDEVVKTWQESDKAAFEHEKYGEYFKPVEGDAEGNQRLAKGRSMAQRAFTENPFDPKHTPSERATIVKRQNSVCNRSAAFGRLVNWNKTLKSENAELKKEISEYKNGEPGASEGKSTNNGAPTTASQRAERGLEALAH